MSQPSMPRPQSENTTPVGFKIPDEWIERAEKLAVALSTDVAAVTKTEVLRAALGRGLTALEEETPAQKRKR